VNGMQESDEVFEIEDTVEDEFNVLVCANYY
jgi:hypothetical protein